MSLNPQGNANPLGLSGSAMLVGTVAALQEESGQLRSQWQSDVSRLERELHQLRTAAAYALPQLVDRQQPEIRTEPNLQALVLAGVGGVGSLQQTDRLQQTAGFGCSVPVGDRDQLLGRIAELEQQRKNMELQRDQALMSQRLCGSAGSDCSGFANERFEAQMTDRSSSMRNPTQSLGSQSIPPHEHSSMQLTEALLAQMSTQQSAVEKRFENLQGAINIGARAPPTGFDAPQQSITPDEVYKELERMEMELQKVRDENSRLREEKAACEEAHSRDISTLEAMLTQIMSDNQRLKKALEEAEARLRAQGGMGGCCDGEESCNQSIRSIRSVMEPACEPDLDRISVADSSSSARHTNRFAGMA